MGEHAHDWIRAWMWKLLAANVPPDAMAALRLGARPTLHLRHSLGRHRPLRPGPVEPTMVDVFLELDGSRCQLGADLLVERTVLLAAHVLGWQVTEERTL